MPPVGCGSPVPKPVPCAWCVFEALVFGLFVARRFSNPPVGNATSVGKTALPEPVANPSDGKTPSVAVIVGKADVGFGALVFLVFEDLLFLVFEDLLLVDASLFSKPVPKAVGRGACDPHDPE